jgi:hypothetical protein
MSSDLTLIFCTNQVVPSKWAEYHKQVLQDAAKGHDIISISSKPTGIGIYVEDEPHPNSYYWQMLRGAKIAKTPYIAIVEDDTLYTPNHFNEFRPPLNAVAYNMHRWSLFTWKPGLYSWKPNWAGAACIAAREYFIDALEERFAKYPNGMDRRRCGEVGYGTQVYSYERLLRVSERNKVEFYSFFPIIQFSHDCFSVETNNEETIKSLHRKRMGILRSNDIPYWGKAEDLVKKFR